MTHRQKSYWQVGFLFSVEIEATAAIELARSGFGQGESNGCSGNQS
jgi:hypothetical protein